MKFLVDQLVYGHYCTSNEHRGHKEGADADREHLIQIAQEKSINLRLHQHIITDFAIAVTRVMIDSHNILGKYDELINANKVDIPSEQFSTPTFEHLSTKECQCIYEGIVLTREENNNQNPVSQVCLTLTRSLTEAQNEVIELSIVSFDIDSYIAIPQSFGIARRGMKVYIIFYSVQKLGHILRIQIIRFKIFQKKILGTWRGRSKQWVPYTKSYHSKVFWVSPEELLQRRRR